MVQKNILTITALAAALALVGCGGGGSKGYFNADAPTNNNSGGNGDIVIESIAISELSLKDSNGADTNTISALGAIAAVKVVTEAGQPVSGALVTFSGENMTFSTTNASVFTDADGVASIGVEPTDRTVTGAYILTASASIDAQSATKTKNVSFVKTDIVIDQLELASKSLVSGGSTLITLVTQDQDGQYQNDQAVNFTASCGSFANPSISSTSEGNISNTYYAYDAAGKLCNGKQEITVTPSNAPANAQKVSVDVAAATATSIVYTSQAISIPVLGSGSSSSSQIEFTVYSNGTALSNQDVTLSLVKAPSGASFVSLSNTANKTVKTDSSGKVIVNIYPGNIPGPVEISATLPTGFNALSKDVTITTGRATQNSFSISMSKNSLQTDMDGDEADIVVRLADRTGNTVPDGTVVNFVTEGGKVGGACSTTDGTCSVTISTQNPRKADGRITVLAYVEGDKSYIDKNSDNAYTVGTDTFVNNIGSFFRDDNEDNSHTEGEFKYNRILTGTKQACGTSSFDEPNLKDTCDNQLSAILRQQVVVYFASSTATVPDPVISDDILSFNAYGNAGLTTPMPSGTAVIVNVEDGTKNNNLTCSAELSSGSNPVAAIVNSTYYAYRLKDCAKGDTFNIRTTAPNGKISNFYVNY